MAENAKVEESSRDGNGNSVNQCQKAPKSKARSRDKDSPVSVKRRCVSTACIACRRRKSKVCQESLNTPIFFGNEAPLSLLLLTAVLSS